MSSKPRGSGERLFECIDCGARIGDPDDRLCSDCGGYLGYIGDVRRS